MFINLDWQECKVGDVTCLIKTLEFWATQKIMGLFSGVISESKNDGEKVMEALSKSENNPLSNPEFDRISKEIMPNHCKDLKGLDIQLQGEERREATVEDLIEHEGLAMIRLQIVMQIFSISNAGGDQKEELKKPLLD